MRVASFATVTVAALAFAVASSGRQNAEGAAASSVTVYPSGPHIAQRLLRISLEFAVAQDVLAPPDVHLRLHGGREIDHPFAGPPLWSTDRRTLTLLLAPSRQKTGLRDHVLAGFVLPARRAVDVLVGVRVVKTWFVESGSCAPLDPTRWSIGAVRVGTRDALAVDVHAPIDMLSRERLAVAGVAERRVAGRSRLGDGERRWTFVPKSPWRGGERLAVHPRLEDPCGDEPDEPFEHAAGTGLASARHVLFLPLATPGPKAPRSAMSALRHSGLRRDVRRVLRRVRRPSGTGPERADAIRNRAA